MHMVRSNRLPAGVIENGIDVAAPADVLFDYMTDLNREPEWNPQMRHAEQLTPGPIGLGTRFLVRFGRGLGPAVIANTAFDRPRSWAAISTARRLTVHSEGTVRPLGGTSRLSIRTDLRPHGPLRLLTPLLRAVMHRSWEQDLKRVKAIIESHAQ